MAASSPRGILLMASAPSPRTIPERISFEQASYTVTSKVQFSYMGLGRFSAL
jgi:hypothetical protein